RRAPPFERRRAMVRNIRRIGTGHDASGGSIFAIEAPSPPVLTVGGRAGFALTNLWVTDAMPARNTGHADAADRPVVLEPPKNGTIFRVVEFPPEKTGGALD